MYQRNIIFRDAEGNKANIDIEITTRNGYPELTMSGDYSGSGGQIVDHIKPKNEYQKELIELWNTKHLKEVDESIINDIDQLCDDIEGEEDDNIIGIHNLESQWFIDKAAELDCEVEKLMAGCLQEGVTVGGLDNIEVDGNRYTFEGNDWLICTDEEADEAHLEDIENLVDDMGMELFNKYYISGPYVERLPNGNIEVKMSIEILSSERANSLNSWDGYEYEKVVNGNYYYLYKQ